MISGSSLRRASLLGPAVVTVCASSLFAQRAEKDAQEFTRQGLLITNFAPLAGADMKFARRTTDAVRSRVAKLANKHDVNVISGDDIAWKFELAGFDPDTSYGIREIRSMSRYFRTDEYVLARVSNGPAGVRIAGDLVLVRDEHLRQPLPVAVAPNRDSAASLFARSINAARTQLTYERRCENSLRDGSADRAIENAREGIGAYSRGAIARTCLLWALQKGGRSSATMLATAREILDIDSTNTHAMEAAAIALDSLKRRDEAAREWIRLARSDTADLDLQLRVAYALIDGGNSKPAEGFISAVSDSHPEDIRLVQQKWRAAYENKSWARAIAAGEVLLERDSVAQRDSSFYLRLGAAYRAYNRPYKSIETLARAVTIFPKNAHVYSVYTQYIKAEADTVVPRGLALFPRSAELIALNAKELRTHGKLQESLDATKAAIALDSTMAQGQLTVAQLAIELGRPDSALVALHRAIASGEDTSLVAQFALAKGNTMYRAANATKTAADFAVALSMLAFADSVRPTPESRFLVGASALGVAQAMVADASKSKDKSETCRLIHSIAGMSSIARAGIAAGQEMFAEAAKQASSYLDQLDPYVQQQLKTDCAEPSAPR